MLDEYQISKSARFHRTSTWLRLFPLQKEPPFSTTQYAPGRKNISPQKALSDSGFSVPHVDRKRILRQIEAKFIRRDPAYYDLNNMTDPFCKWWENISSAQEETIPYKRYPLDLIAKHIDPKNSYWIAAEFRHGTVWLYKAQKKAALDLMDIGRTWSDTYHLNEAKYRYMLSFKWGEGEIQMKRSGWN